MSDPGVHVAPIHASHVRAVQAFTFGRHSRRSQLLGLQRLQQLRRTYARSQQHDQQFGAPRGTFRLVRWLAVAALAGVVVAACSLEHHDQARVPLHDCLTPIEYVALGDSTVEGVGASRPDLNYVSRLHTRLRALYPHARLTNLGMGGATSAEVITQQLGRAIALQPDLVTLSIGPNDITRGVPVTRYERNLDTILGRLRHETAALVVVNLLPDLAVTPRFANGPQRSVVGRQTVLFNETLARKGEEYGVVLVDLYLASQEEVPGRPALLWKDGYHPSDAGYARWAELMWAGIKPRLTVC
jgi:acyl-CoA thioesterase I